MAQVPLFPVESAYFFPVISIERRKAPSDARGWGGGDIQSVVARSSLSMRLCARFSQQLEQKVV